MFAKQEEVEIYGSLKFRELPLKGTMRKHFRPNITDLGEQDPIRMDTRMDTRNVSLPVILACPGLILRVG